MTCPVCGRESPESYCDFHKTAYDNLVKTYSEWKEAMDISWDKYLRIVIDNPGTGLWVVEVAKDLLKKGNGSPEV